MGVGVVLGSAMDMLDGDSAPDETSREGDSNDRSPLTRCKHTRRKEKYS